MTNNQRFALVSIFSSFSAACSGSVDNQEAPDIAQLGVSLEGDGTVTTLAEGLTSPRGLHILGDTLTLAEAGIGGDAPCQVGPTGDSACLGANGTLRRLKRTRLTTLVDGLPSVGNGFTGNGPHDVVAVGNNLLAVTGFGFFPEQREGFGPAAESLGTLTWYGKSKRGLTVKRRVDLATFEDEHNPDGEDLVSNPFSLAVDCNRVLVVDSGANDLLSVTDDGIEVVAVFPSRLVAAPPDFPVPELPMQAVPTGVALDSTGEVFVAEMTGFPFPPGESNVYRVAQDGPVVFASDFTNIIDIAFDDDDNLYVLEHATNGLLSGDPSGRLVLVTADGTRQTLLDGTTLTYPTSVAVDARNRVYIANCGNCGEGTGSVIRYDP